MAAESNYMIQVIMGALSAGTGVFFVHTGLSLMQLNKSKKGNGEADIF